MDDNTQSDNQTPNVGGDAPVVTPDPAPEPTEVSTPAPEAPAPETPQPEVDQPVAGVEPTPVEPTPDVSTETPVETPAA